MVARKKSAASNKKTAKKKSRKTTEPVEKTSLNGEKTPTHVQKTKKRRLSTKTRKEFKDMLFRLRDRLNNQITALKNDSLRRNDSASSEENGTDAFERQFALSLVSSEHDSLFEIEEALRRIEAKTYGVCEKCKLLIEMPRLKALPFARMCIRCKSEIENGRPGSRTRNSAAHQIGVRNI